jgi:surfeit locus 1 family protein
MTRASRIFRPPWWATAGLVLGCALFGTAGLWQLERAQEKSAMYRDFQTSELVEVLTEPIADEELAASWYRPMRLTGRYDPNHQFLLDMMVHQGQVGYHVLTPLLRDGDGDGLGVLVNRGWVAAGADRSVLPDITLREIAEDNLEITGLIMPLPSAGISLKPDAADAAIPWPRRLTFPSADDMRAHLDYPIAGYQLLLDPDAADGFARAWQPQVMTPDKHVAYAVQWFGLAIALFIIYIVVNLKKVSMEEGA